MSSIFPAPSKPVIGIPDFFVSASKAAIVLGVSRRRLYRFVEERTLLPDGWVDGEMRFRYSRLVAFVTSGVPRTVERLRKSHPPRVLNAVQSKVQA